MKKYLLFDLDGTLSDPKKGITRSAMHALASFGIHVEDADALTPFIGPPLRTAFPEMYGFSLEQTEEAVVKFREYFSTKGVYEHELYAGMKEFLAMLSGKATLIVATSKPKVFAESVLRQSGIDGYFAYVSGDELDGSRAEKITVMRDALQHMGIENVDDCVMVGDRKYDILAAKELGMESVGVTYGYGSREELDEAGATHIADDLESLYHILTQ